MQKVEEYRTGEVILKQGKMDNGFYVLEKGAVEVYKNDIMLNVLIYPGTIFGEIGDILHTPRTCTVKARTQTKVIKYECPDLETLVEQHPDIAVKIMQTLASRLERTTQKLADLSNTSAFFSEEKK
ncbi:Crp/Fnr family transcriptional regulator [Coraliomargarita algicola]|uniref:Crp/Fnr family transcriptional regulator n=1 Tax=Coraliomargarita algicola TaxID=3092156 RepID=A0ABZ0RG09_9BACT|nr:Crp/Fnr family transcriptional regulator [Coraliomargarita sp. J2-16]WPJ93955.1 Crp/Fnr family transcriptional regulator [Coraliomargarita sp. J2-16]